MPFTPRTNALPGIAKKTVTTSEGIKVDHVKLEPGVVGEAVDGSTILINKDVPKNGELYRRAVAHESLHAKEMLVVKSLIVKTLFEITEASILVKTVK